MWTCLILIVLSVMGTIIMRKVSILKSSILNFYHIYSFLHITGSIPNVFCDKENLEDFYLDVHELIYFHFFYFFHFFFFFIYLVSSPSIDRIFLRSSICDVQSNVDIIRNIR